MAKIEGVPNSKPHSEGGNKSNKSEKSEKGEPSKSQKGDASASVSYKEEVESKTKTIAATELSEQVKMTVEQLDSVQSETQRIQGTEAIDKVFDLPLARGVSDPI